MNFMIGLAILMNFMIVLATNELHDFIGYK